MKNELTKEDIKAALEKVNTKINTPVWTYPLTGPTYDDVVKSIREKERIRNRAMISATQQKETARTQKAKGLDALKNFDGPVPPYAIVKIENTEPINLVGKFVRPCPMTPRHGFVDSRLINTKEEAFQILEETKAADAQAEFILMDKINAEFSGVWTEGLLSVGKGHDGATAGTSALAFPTIGRLFSPYWPSESVLNAAEIKNSPYMEILWEKQKYGEEFQMWKVQLRDGPKLPQTVDFIPDKLTVKEVLLAEGDLLAWECKMKDVPKGTVVYHPNGSLASHYAVHAVLNNVPVLVSRKPEVGEALERIENQSVKVNIKELRAGFQAAIESEADYELAAKVMLVGLHHLTLWKGKFDFLLGVSMGFAYRLTVLAGLGEYRHLPTRKYRPAQRSNIYKKYWRQTLKSAIKNRFQKVLKSFAEDPWQDGFGGEMWFKFTKWAAVIYNELLDGNGEAALEALNQVVHSAHNGGWGFNKFISESVMTEGAENPVIVLAEVAPFMYTAVDHFKGKHDKLAKEFKFKKRKLTYPEIKSKFREDEFITEAQIKIVDIKDTNTVHIQYKTNKSTDRNKYKAIDVLISETVKNYLTDKFAYMLEVKSPKQLSMAQNSKAEYFKLKVNSKKKAVYLNSAWFNLDKEISGAY